MSFSSLEKIAIVLLLAILIYFVKLIFQIVYTYAIGPVVNKVDFKSKGKWARKYLTSSKN